MEKKQWQTLAVVAAGLLLLFFALTYNRHPYRLTVCNGEGLTYMETWVYCDEFQMISPTEAEVVVDGKSMRIQATRAIRPESN